MQGWDSVEIHADVELGGTEQLYNLMVGRDLQRTSGQEPQICLTMPILRGLDGVKKMGKSLGNYIGLNEPAKEQFGKTMSIADTLLTEWYMLLTDRTHDGVAEPSRSATPNEAKKALGAEIVRFYHGDAAGGRGRRLADWDKQSSKKIDPDNIDEVTICRTWLTRRRGDVGGRSDRRNEARGEQRRSPAEDRGVCVQLRPRPHEARGREGNRAGHGRFSDAIGAEDPARAALVTPVVRDRTRRNRGGSPTDNPAGIEPDRHQIP